MDLQMEKRQASRSVQDKNGVTTSRWQGIFTATDGDKLLFKGLDTSKNNKFVVLRTYFTKSDNL
jgi:hypothetical protein